MKKSIRKIEKKNENKCCPPASFIFLKKDDKLMFKFYYTDSFYLLGLFQHTPSVILFVPMCCTLNSNILFKTI